MRSLLVLAALCALAAARPRAQAVEPLWPGAAPGALDTTADSRPTLTHFPADPGKAMGTAVVICPGGGYGHLASDKEGDQIAKWFNSLGVAGFVLKYRIAPYRHPIEMNDAKRALRYVKANARRFRIDPARVGIAGFSAGGHLAATVATHSDDGDPRAADSVERQGCRPYFQVLGYPVITMEGPYAHAGSRNNLLGPNPAGADLRFLSNEKQITARTPPAFLVHAQDDPTVRVENSLLYRDSLLAHGIPVQAKIYPHGPHGFGLADGVAGAPDLPEIAGWPGLCASWLEARGFLAKATSIRASGPAPASRPGEARVDPAGRRAPRGRAIPWLPVPR